MYAKTFWSVMNTSRKTLTCPSPNQNIDYMNTVVIYFIQNTKKFYLDCNGYWTTNRQEAQQHWESQVPHILRDNPFNYLHNCQYELA